MTSLDRIFPAFGLRLTAGPLELAGLTDADLPVLVDLVARGVHDSADMPFTVPWTDVPEARAPLAFAQFHWRTRADFTASEWTLNLVVRHEGEVVGVQGISTNDYLVTRTGETGSWLAWEFHGRGIGTAMRQAMCAFVFDHLDAAEITSGAFTDNPASRAVSRKVGYRENGRERRTRRPGELATLVGLVLTPEDFVRGEHPVEVEGSAAFRHSIGLDSE